MRIGIIGSGIVAKTLGEGFIKMGHEVMLGSRTADKLADWKNQSGGDCGSFNEVSSFGELLVLAVKGSAAKDALDMCGSENLAGKVIIDTTNPISDAPPVNGVLQFFTEQNDSLMEQLQRHVPDARFVKAFNSIGSAYMVHPQFDQKPAMFICGNSKEACATVTEILVDFGFEVENMGKMEAARAIEPLCMLWCIPGFIENRWTHAFKLMKA